MRAAAFDRPDNLATRWPTFGIRLAARTGLPPTHPVGGPLSLSLAMLDTLLSNQDSAYIDDPCTVRRTIFVPADVASPIDFRITSAQSAALYDAGLSAGAEFLKSWNWKKCNSECGRVNPGGDASPRP